MIRVAVLGGWILPSLIWWYLAYRRQNRQPHRIVLVWFAIFVMVFLYNVAILIFELL